MKGYIGKILIVDLTTGIFEEQKVEDEVYENLLSGVGLGAYTLYKNIPKGADPLGPDNMLGFVSGLLTGTGSVMTGRWMVVCKSPLTGGWGDSNCGGTFSPAIKQCGYDGIFFKGISVFPVYLYVDNRGAELRDASYLWGKDAVETEDILEKENWNNKKPAIAVIGTSSEKKSLISGICNDRGRIAARSGVGAVMGSKRLKAVVLAGSKPIKCHDPKTVKKYSKEFSKKIKKTNMPQIMTGRMLPLMGKALTIPKNIIPIDGIVSASMMKKWGTGFGNTMGMYNGDDPIKNWAGSVVDYDKSYYNNVNPDKVLKREYKKYHCYSCVIGCGGVCDIKGIGNGEFTHTHKPEYETVNAFGALLMNKDLESIFYINELLNRAGMDSISAGNTIAYAIECYENGLITKDDTDGLELTWGNAEAIVELVKRMIARQGFGDVLADGVKVAVKKIGEETSKYAMHAGGQEPGMHDPRMDPALGVHYSADPTPGRHTVGAFGYYNYMHLWTKVSWVPKLKLSTPKKVEFEASDRNGIITMANSCIKQILDGSGGCLFAMISGVHNWKIFEWLNAATGWDKTPDEYMIIGKRMQTLRQMFNIREGINPIDFKIKDRIAGRPPLKEGPLKGKTLPIEGMIQKHWEHFGWNPETGVPTEETIEELGLDELLNN